jgi:hypothetical protein
MTPPTPVGPRTILAFWSPLAATWLMMSVEGPFLAAVIARLPTATLNLAAYGVAYSLALIVEAPVIMMTSAATALVRDRQSLAALRRFAYGLNAAITVFMALALLPPVFSFITETLIGLPHEVAWRTHLATALLLPWPGAIGYRRFNQGVLIRSGLTRRVAYGTIVRLGTMASTALVLYRIETLPGAAVGAAALAAGVTVEAAASRLMAAPALRDLRARPRREPPLTLPSIAVFYYPLALTSMLTLGVQPLVTFFMGRSRAPVESLAVLPVVIALVFVFRSLGLAYQEVGIALIGERHEHYVALRRFATGLGVATAAGLSLIAWTPLAGVWLRDVSGLSPELARFALPPLRILCVMPGLSVLLSFQRAMLVNHGATRFVTGATVTEVSGIAAVMLVCVAVLGLPGAVAAATAFMVGRIGANLYLTPPLRRLRRARAVG